ncbi:MAG: OadG family protein [Clostridia bacterium]|nr:OadG family protein [Clostridia bacterium]
MSFNCKRLVCVLIALVMVICMTSVVAFAEGSEDVSQEESMTENSAVTENNGETIFEIIENGEGTFMERLAHGGKVTLVGMLVVFAVLIVLMIVLYVFQWIFGAKSKKVASVKESVPAPAPVSAPVVNATNNEEEVVAVATAAIAAARGESECAFNVISITQID